MYIFIADSLESANLAVDSDFASNTLATVNPRGSSQGSSDEALSV